MVAHPPVLNAHRWRILAFITLLLISLYMLTYSGQIESGDTLTLFDASESLVYFGDTLLDKTAWFNTRLLLTQNHGYPFYDIDIELGQVYLAAPLIWLADKLPQVGLVHAAWLFNVLACTAVCALFYCYSLVLGYTDRTSAVAALALGICTIFWPYSRTFFREPLATCLVLVGALCMERWRVSRYRSLRLLVLSILAIIGGLLTKEAIIFAIPALVIIVFPAWKGSTLWHERWHRLVGILLIILILMIAAFATFSILANSRDFTPLYAQMGTWISRNAEYVRTIHVALHSYLLSIGGSFWGTSPVVLLAVPGLWMLYRRRQYRYVAVIVLIAAGFILGYARLREIHWFGGLSWPPRFLIPIVPFLMLGTLPVIEDLFRRPFGRRLLLAVLLMAYSAWVQLSGVTLPWGAYNAALPPEAGGLSEWSAGLNTVQYLRWVVIPQQWGRLPLDFAWVRTGSVIWPIGFAAFLIYSTVALFRLLKGISSQPISGLRTLFASIALFLLIWLGLRSIYHDPVYQGDRQSLWGMLPLVEAQTRAGDVLLLNNNTYERFLLNYARWRSPRVMSLPPQPGDGLEQSPDLHSITPDVLLVKSSIPLIYNLAQSRNYIWLLADSGPWIPSSVRPVERFLVSHYYPIGEFTTDPPDPNIRLIQYSTVVAPSLDSFRAPEVLTDLRYGDSIRLLGFMLPKGTTYQSGESLPISLYWQTEDSLDHNYTVAWFLVDANNIPVVQGMDYQPAWGFSPTTIWQPNVPLWDNRALNLPVDLPPGSYHLWVRLYQSDAPDVLLSVAGENVFEDTIGVLPVEIKVAN
ncbi:MAG: hypothetical protein K8L97_15260 [Anaerolineae bacterium]|nr:hypothetical protein [Anaerolineae bacterium]